MKVSWRAGMTSPQRVFTLCGKVHYAGGGPVRAMLVSVVEDGATPNLLGAGLTSEFFSIAFSSVALNAEPSALHLVVSVLHPDGDRLVPVLRRDVAQAALQSASEGVSDLGVIVLPLAEGATPVALPGVDPTPGLGVVRKRLRLDADLVFKAELASDSVLDQHTEWKWLHHGARFEIVDDFVEVLSRRALRLLGRSSLGDREAELVAFGARSFDALALWDHDSRTVYLNRPELEQQNVNVLYCTVGHELVHVGQSKHHPEIDRELDALSARVWAGFLAEQPVDEEIHAALFGLMANIEGYARYVEDGLLAQIFTSALQLDRQPSLVPAAPPPRRTHNDLDALVPIRAPSLRSSLMTKAAQYDTGARVYRGRKRGRGGLAPFDPALRPSPFLSKARLDELTGRALAGGVEDQVLLGDAYRYGLGVPADLPKARRWYRIAAATGSAEAALRLEEIEVSSPALGAWSTWRR